MAGAALAIAALGFGAPGHLALGAGEGLGPAWAFAAGRSVSPETAARWMDALTASRADAQEAVRQLLAAGDVRFIAVFIDMMRAGELGVVKTLDQADMIRALTALSGKGFGDDWPAWVDWYRTAALTPPPRYVGWKGRLFARFDPNLREFLNEDAPARIRVEEVEWTGIPVDGVAALTRPKTVPATSAAGIAASEPVFGLALNGYARAYPLRVLQAHELVNDRVGGVAIALTYCALCGAGIAYEGQGTNGTTYIFGSSGLLYRSSKLMYDRQTRTLWNEFTGRPALGPLAQTPVRLRVRPLVLTSWSAWLAEHPETKVLDPEADYDRPYAGNTPHRPYYRAAGPVSPLWRESQALPEKTLVFALRVAGIPKAFPLDALRSRGVVNDTVGGVPVVLIAEPTSPPAPGRHHRGGSAEGARDPVVTPAGEVEVRAFARGIDEFRPGPDRHVVVDSRGQRWGITEEALVGPGAARAPRLPGFVAYWFAWYEFFPQTLLYQR